MIRLSKYDIDWRITAAAALIILGVATCCLAGSFSGSRPRGSLVIGIPEGTGGVIPRAIIKDSDLKPLDMPLDGVSFNDCCSSNISLALSGGEVSMAVLCPESARQLLLKDQRYALVGPVAANCDVLVVRPGAAPQSIGVMHNRPDQEKIVRAYYGRNCRIVQMMPGALPYAYERKAVDGVVVDALQAYDIAGQTRTGSVQGTPLISYVLVVRKELIGTPDYEALMRKWAEMVPIFNDPEHAEELILREIPGDREKEVKKWIQLNVIFMDPKGKA